MNILIIGGGGREHAIAWKLAQSPLNPKLFIAPGNGGTAALGENCPVKATDIGKQLKLAVDKKIDFVIVGPDDPLALGIVDAFRDNILTQNIPILGPFANGAKLESSKDFAKQFMMKNNIPTAKYKTFNQSQYTEAKDYIQNHKLPVVIKADGLAAGKGVAVCFSFDEALDFLNSIYNENKFGNAGEKVVIEEFLEGIELSVFVLTDGKNYRILPEAKDYKRILEGDKGPNTGGIGAVSPVSFADEKFMQKVEDQIIKPTITGLQNERIDYRGLIFLGLMNVQGNPYVIEYNARMGDPETQVVFPRIKSDILPILLQTAKGELVDDIKIDPNFATTVIAVSKGYPDDYEKDKNISGLDLVENSIVFHAGTDLRDDKFYTSGGRVLAVTSFGKTLDEALEKSYKNLELINFEGITYRKDIGNDLKFYQP